MSCSNSSPNPFSIANHFSPSMKSMCHSLKHLYRQERHRHQVGFMQQLLLLLEAFLTPLST
ncbi:hypothetical protein T09_10901 [Trichinella sp. T9]|nr:hypothetical protein T09_10901 [Trichinella sp. T9]